MFLTASGKNPPETDTLKLSIGLTFPVAAAAIKNKLFFERNLACFAPTPDNKRSVEKTRFSFDKGIIPHDAAAGKRRLWKWIIHRLTSHADGIFMKLFRLKAVVFN